MTMRLVPTSNEITPMIWMTSGVLENMAILGVSRFGLIASGHMVLGLNVPNLRVAASVTCVMRNKPMTISNSALPEHVVNFVIINLDL